MKRCLECGIQITGRTDKKYCSDHCRNYHNNLLYKHRNEAIKKINGKLKKNTVILERLITHGISNISKVQLQAEGFDFGFFTHQFTVSTGEKYNCCYNYGYTHQTKDEIILFSLHS
jgi:hypothetical protein